MVGRGASRVPERWTDYIPLGCRMPGTRFIAFKVPLKESFDQNLLPEDRFSPHDLIRQVRERQEELGLIIDLTYTGRYYGREELPPTLRYCKILTMGHEIPNRKTIVKFKDLVKKFLTDNKDNDKLIGVHCTHGLNRTGYLVCRYLIDVEGMEPNAAIELFNKSRGHPIERTNYIKDLQRRALKNCEVKNLVRKKGSAPAKPQKQLVKAPPRQAPLAVPRNAGSTKKKQRPDPRAQGQPQELGHRALGQRQLEQKQVKKLEQRQFEKLEQRQQKHLEQKQQKKLEQRQQKKLKKKLEQRQQKKLKDLEQNHLEQRQLEKHNHLEQRQQNHLEQRQQNHLEQKQQRQQNHLEQKQQNHLEQKQQRQQNHLEQRQQKKLRHLEQNYLDQRQNHLEQRQPCSLAPRNCWLPAAPKKQRKELFPLQSPQAWLPQEPSPARKRRRRRRKHKLQEQERS